MSVWWTVLAVVYYKFFPLDETITGVTYGRGINEVEWQLCKAVIGQ